MTKEKEEEEEGENVIFGTSQFCVNKFVGVTTGLLDIMYIM